MSRSKSVLGRVRDKAVASGRSNKPLMRSRLFRGMSNMGVPRAFEAVFHRGATGKFRRKRR